MCVYLRGAQHEYPQPNNQPLSEAVISRAGGSRCRASLNVGNRKRVILHTRNSCCVLQRKDKHIIA
jgi:hypothetical protein